MVPYTLPGVLALVGCWWYLSRKKQASVTHGNAEGPPAAAALKTSSSEGSNGLLESAAAPTQLPAKAEQSAKGGAAAQMGGAEQTGDVPADRRREERRREGPARCSSPKQAELRQAPPAGCPSPTAAAERPEPEGEVAVVTEDAVVACAPTEKEPPSEGAEPPETLPLAQEFNRHLLAGTPAAVASAVQESPEDVRASAEDERRLELLAAGLISEVIMAAQQEVLSCSLTDHRRPPCSSSTPLGPAHSQQDPIAAQRHRLPLNGREEAESEDSGMPNGCSPADGGVRQTNGVQAAQTREGTRAASAPGEDSACSTCPSEDGASGEDRRSSCGQATPTQAGPAGEDAAAEDAKRLNGLNEAETDQSGGSDVNSMDSVDSGCTMGVSEGNHAASPASELVVWEVEVPKALVGRLIGKQGRYVSYLKQTSGAKIYISTLPYTQDFQICHMEGTRQQVDKALSLIGKKFKELDLSNLYAPPPPPLALPSLPMTSWLLLPSGVTVEVIVVNIVSAGHVFVQQHTHPTYHALRSLDQQMFLCYSQPSTPALPSPAEVGVICAAPAGEGAWWRAQVITFYKDSGEVEIRYVDYGGYDRVKIDSLRQIRSDFVTLPFQGAEVLLDSVAPLPGEDRFSAEATSALEEMTRGVALLAQVSNYDNNTGLPLVHLWNVVGDEVVLVNRTLVERGLGVWVDGF